MRHETFVCRDPFPAGPKPHKASARELIDRVGAWHGVSREIITGQSKPKGVIAARFDAIAAVRVAYPRLSKTALGRIFGGRDHTTIINALRKRGLQ